MSHSTIFLSCREGATASCVLPVLLGSKVSCSRTNTAEVGFERPTSHSGVRRSTNEPPHSPFNYLWQILGQKLNNEKIILKITSHQIPSHTVLNVPTFWTGNFGQFD